MFLSKQLLVKNFKLEIITTDRTSKNILQNLKDRGIKIHYVTMRILRENEGFRATPFNIYYSFDLNSILRFIKPKYIYSEGVAGLTFSTIFYSIFNKVEYVISYERTIITERYASFFKKLYFYFFDFFFSPYYIVNGKATKELLNKRNVNTERIREPNIASPFIIKPKNFDKERNQIPEKIQLLWVAQLSDRKNAPWLIKLCKSWDLFEKKYDLTIIGKGKYQNQIEELAILKKISYKPFVDPSMVRLNMIKSDILLLPTLEDNWSLVVLEAAACKCLSLTTEENGISKDFEDSISILVRNVDEFLDFLQDMSFTRKDLDFLQNQAYQRSLFFSNANVSNALLSVIH